MKTATTSSKRAFRYLWMAIAVGSANQLCALLITGDVPIAAYVAGAAINLGVLTLGWWRTRMALWCWIAISALGFVLQFVPPIELWRVGVAMMDAFAAFIAVQGLRVEDREKLMSPHDDIGG